MDLVVVKCRAAAALFPELRGTGRLMVVPWRSDMEATALDARERRFLYMIGGSPCKTLAARAVVACWRASWPPLEVWCSPEIAGMLRPLVGAEARVEGIQFENLPSSARRLFPAVGQGVETFPKLLRRAEFVGHPRGASADP